MRSLFACLLFCLTGTVFSRAAPAPPNIVLFLVDDLGWMDLRCQGSSYYKTPSIDRLATEGVRFTDAYAACAVCSPTRAAILTGRYPARLLLTQWLPAGRWNPQKHKMKEGRFLRSLPLEEITIAERLRAVGYSTWHVGKWHLGGEPFSMPEHHGFGVNIAGNDHGAPGSYFYPFTGSWEVPTTGIRIHKQAWDGGSEGDYLTDGLTGEVENLIKNQNDNIPFFLYFSYYAVHTPLQGKPELKEKFQAVPKEQQQGKPDYAAMIESVDQSVGRVVSALEKAGKKENTLIIFTSDNGGFAGATNNSPLRANKGSHYEGGIRVPLIISGPELGVQSGKIESKPVISCDIYSTILSFSSSPVPGTDGHNLAPLLTGEGDNTSLAERPLFWHYPHYNRHPSSAPVSIVRKGKWKLIEYLETGKTELYDLESDLGETTDLSNSNTNQAKNLLALLLQWKSEVRAEPMIPNPEIDKIELDAPPAKKSPKL